MPYSFLFFFLSAGGAGPGGNGRKRKMSDVDSTDMDSEPSTSAGGLTRSKLSQDNALLAQLLSRKVAKETVVNTQLTINPTGNFFLSSCWVFLCVCKCACVCVCVCERKTFCWLSFCPEKWPKKRS
jgi:hypothetical protein